MNKIELLTKGFEKGRGLTKDGWEQSDWEAFEELKVEMNLAKPKWKTMEETYYKGRQSLVFKGIYKFGDDKIKIVIDHDSIDFQSNGNAKKWNNDEWKYLEGLHSTKMAVVSHKCPIYVDVEKIPHTITMHYRTDINKLKRKVENILL